MIGVILALALPLHSIDSPIPAVSVGALALILGVALCLWKMDWSNFCLGKPQLDMLVLFLLFLLITGIHLVFNSNYDLSAIIVRVIRWGFYVCASVVFSSTLDFQYLRKLLIRITIFAAVFLLVQYAVYRLFGRVLAIRIGGETIGAAMEGVYQKGVLKNRIWRLSSFFAEPAHFSYYCNLGLALLVFYRSDTHFSTAEIVSTFLIVIAVGLCSSAYGIILLAIQFGWFLWKRVLHRGHSSIKLIVFIAFFLVAFWLFTRSQQAQYVQYKLQTLSQRERFQFAWQFLRNQSAWERVFGIGVGNEEYYFRFIANRPDTYLNSVSLTYLYCGWAGLGMVMIYYAKQLLSCPDGNRLLMILFLAMSVFSTSFYAPIMILFTAMYTAGNNTAVWCGVEHQDRLPDGVVS